MHLRIVLICLFTSLFSATTFAEGIAIEPGLWEMNMTMEMSMLPQPQVHSSQECIKESELHPDDFNMDENSPCNISNAVLDGNTASWSISCPAQDGMEMTGQWEMTSKGDTVNGAGSMTGNAGGMKMEFKMTWDGKRIGDCD